MPDSLYDTATKPLWTAPSRWGQIASNFVLDREKDPNQQWFLLPRAMAAGAAEGIGDLASNLTSPVNLAATALTGGSAGAARAGLPAIASGLRTGARLASVPVVAEGARNVAGPNRTLPERAMGATQVAAGLAGARGPTKAPVTRPSRTIPQRPTEMGRILERLRAESANEPHAAKVQRAGDMLHESMGKSGKAPRNPWDELFNDETGSIGDRDVWDKLRQSSEEAADKFRSNTEKLTRDRETLQLRKEHRKSEAEGRPVNFENAKLKQHPINPDPEKIAIIEDLGPKWIGYADDGGDLFNFARQIRSGESGAIGWSHGPLTPEEEVRLIQEGYKLIKRSEMK